MFDWNRDATDPYAESRAALEAKGQPIGNMDLLIAAHARSWRAMLLTNNERHHVRTRPGTLFYRRLSFPAPDEETLTDSWIKG